MSAPFPQLPVSTASMDQVIAFWRRLTRTDQVHVFDSLERPQRRMIALDDARLSGLEEVIRKLKQLQHVYDSNVESTHASLSAAEANLENLRAELEETAERIQRRSRSQHAGFPRAQVAQAAGVAGALDSTLMTIAANIRNAEYAVESQRAAYRGACDLARSEKLKLQEEIERGQGYRRLTPSQWVSAVAHLTNSANDLYVVTVQRHLRTVST